MTTVPSASINMTDISSAFGAANNLAAYYNYRWFNNSNNARGYFQSSGAISFSDFAGKRNTSPVVSGSRTISGSGNISPGLPMFNNLTVTVVAGQGGQAGTSGNCAGGGGGGQGGDTYLSGYVGVGGGAGGSPSAGYGTQPSSSTTVSITDANQSSIIALYGTSPYAAVGGGGGGGATGYNGRNVFQCVSYVYYYGVPVCNGGVTYTVCDVGVANGGGGASGYIVLSWN